jgi:hypothetical protein
MRVEKDHEQSNGILFENTRRGKILSGRKLAFGEIIFILWPANKS